MKLRRRQEGEVVSTVGDVGADQSQAVPEGGGGQVGAHDHGSDHHRQCVGDLRVRRRVCDSSSWMDFTVRLK